jgi:hypothetical protein
MANFINSQNRNLLLEILIDKNNNKIEYINNINNILNTTINEIINKYSINTSNLLQYNNILNLNRETILLCNKKIYMYDLNYTNYNKIKRNESYGTPINVKDREKQKQLDFENKVLKNKSDFESYKPSPPKNISFKDEISDKCIGDEMDILISKTIEMREKQINKIFLNSPQSISSTSEQEMKTHINDKNDINTFNIKKINIGQETKMDNIIDLSTTNIKEINEEERKDLNVLFNSLKIKNNIQQTISEKIVSFENPTAKLTTENNEIFYNDEKTSYKYMKYLSPEFIDEKINKFESLLNILDEKIKKFEDILYKIEANTIYKRETEIIDRN